MSHSNIPVIPNKLITHNGPFHSDDVMCVALMTLINPDIEVVRTRDESLFERNDWTIKVDVGGKYDPEHLEFDHHLEEDKIDRHPNFLWNREERIGPKKSGIGLIWDVYGKYAIQTYLQKEHQIDPSEIQLNSIFNYLKRFLVVPIDIEDNGEQRTYFGLPASPYNPFTISAIIRVLNPQIRDENLHQSIKLTDDAFKEAVKLASSVLKGYILRQYYSIKDVDFIKGLVLIHDGSPIFVIPTICSWYYALIALERNPETSTTIKNIYFVVYPVPNDQGTGYNWIVSPTKSWNRQERSFTMKMPLAENLRGKPVDELKTITGIPTLTFVHPTGFLGGTTDQDDAVKLAQYTWDNVQVNKE
jgi:uncharacterized UPF0160 family protein